MPIILGCGGCGLLIVLAAIAFFVIGAIGKRAAEQGSRSAVDSTYVAGDTTSASTGSDASSTDASTGDSTSDTSSGTTGEGKPSDKPTGSTSADTLPVREMQPLNP